MVLRILQNAALTWLRLGLIFVLYVCIIFFLQYCYFSTETASLPSFSQEIHLFLKDCLFSVLPFAIISYPFLINHGYFVPVKFIFFDYLLASLLFFSFSICLVALLSWAYLSQPHHFPHYQAQLVILPLDRDHNISTPVPSFRQINLSLPAKRLLASLRPFTTTYRARQQLAIILTGGAVGWFILWKFILGSFTDTRFTLAAVRRRQCAFSFFIFSNASLAIVLTRLL